MPYLHIPIINTEPDWANIPKIPVSVYPWGGDYRPQVTAQIAYGQDKGFFIRMQAEEVNPRAVYTMDTDPVHEDSCLEFFVNFTPNNPDKGYINFETNFNGALHCNYGKGRGNRTPVGELGAIPPKVTINSDEKSWSCSYLVDLAMISKIYGKSKFSAGDIIRCNFYKCGDKTDFPHYASWSPIETPNPDFHQPNFFGTLIL